MKRKIGFLYSILLILVLSLGLTACNDGGTHEHTFEEAYTYDATYHWHKATCEHLDEVQSKAEHDYNQGEEQENGEILFSCQTCGYSYTHSHTYEESFTSNETHHYYKASCGHDVIKEKNPHDFDEGILQTSGEILYTCQTCEYTILHTHTYAEEYSYDEDRHWLASTCEHETEVKGKGYHVYGAGEKQPTGETHYTCQTCGYIKSIVHHEHTFEETYTYDADKHWFKATCNHKDEISGLAEHRFGEAETAENGDLVYVCQDCNYEASGLQVRVKNLNEKYVRTQKINSYLEFRFLAEENPFETKWRAVQPHNVESYVIDDGEIEVTISVVVKNVKHTSKITLKMEEEPISVEKIFNGNVGREYMLNGIVAGFSTTASANELILSDKETGKLISVTKIGEGSVLHGGYYLEDISKGDEIIIPVTLTKDAQSSSNANSNKLYAKFNGGTFYETAIISRNNEIKLQEEVVIIESQEEFEEFFSGANRSSNIYKTVKIKGNLSFVLSTSYELFTFHFTGKEVTSANDVKIDGIAPVFSNPAVYYTTGISFNELVFGSPHASTYDYANPLTKEVELTAVYLGGNTSYGQFLILDQSLVK